MSKRHFILFLLLSALTGLGQAPGQDSVAKSADPAEFRLSPAAVAAGIDGRLAVKLNISPEGRATDIRIFGSPMWPCRGPKPDSVIDEVKKAVKEHILAMKFSPGVREGKPVSSDAEITFMLSERIKGAANMPGRLFRPDIAEPGLVDVRKLDSFAESLRQPSKLVRSRGLMILQVLVDVNGKVTHAGVYKGVPELASIARDAACESTFRPATVKGAPVPMTGMLTYLFQ